MPGNWKCKAKYKLYVDFLQWGAWAPKPPCCYASPILKWKTGFSNYFRDRLKHYIKRGLLWPVCFDLAPYGQIFETANSRTANRWSRTFFCLVSIPSIQLWNWLFGYFLSLVVDAVYYGCLYPGTNTHIWRLLCSSH